MLHRRVWLGLELQILESLLDTVSRTTEEEADEIEASYQHEPDWSPDDLANEMMVPFGRLDIAIRAVYHELMAAIEHELQRIAFVPWMESRRATRPPLPAGPELSPEFEAWLKKEVTDQRFWQLVAMIRQHYNVDPSQLERWSAIHRIRSVANDLKHRKGQVDRRPERHNVGSFENHELTLEGARGAIADTELYFDTLWDATETGFL